MPITSKLFNVKHSQLSKNHENRKSFPLKCLPYMVCACKHVRLVVSLNLSTDVRNIANDGLATYISYHTRRFTIASCIFYYTYVDSYRI